MPLIRHKFATQAAADKFSKRLTAMGFRPYQTLRTKFVRGLKRVYYEVEYKR